MKTKTIKIISAKSLRDLDTKTNPLGGARKAENDAK